MGRQTTDIIHEPVQVLIADKVRWVQKQQKPDNPITMDDQLHCGALNSKSHDSGHEEISSRSNTKSLKASRGDKSSERVGMTTRLASTLSWLERKNYVDFEPVEKKLQDNQLKAS